MANILLLRTKTRIPCPPLGLLFLASYLENNKHHARICDLAVENEKVLYDLLYSNEFDAVGISSNISTYYNDLYVSKYIKNNFNLPIIVGGPHPSVAPNDYEHGFDYVVMGDGEKSLTDILTAIENNKKVERIQRNIIDISNIPNPARHLIDYKKYYQNVSDEEKREFVFVSRGCPYNCIFCVGPKIFGPKPKYRNVENVINELKEIKNVYKFRKIRIADDLFIANRDYVSEFCRRLYEEKLDLDLDCQSRIDMISQDILEIMKGVGFSGIFIGIESGNEETLRRIGKPFTIQKIKDTIELIKKEGYLITGSFTVGYPWEKKQDIKNTFSFAKELDLDRIRMYIVTPFPGTELCHKYKDKIINKNYNFYDTKHAVMNGGYLTASEIQELYDTYMEEFDIED